jgi:hypothetical protein
MTQRKTILKSIRFEVFKRDSFTCQYCGGKSPEKILHVDHIKPVADGGENDILNLITSCADCNLGKSDTPLSDRSAINKQRDQLEELNERRLQLEMMLEWREGLYRLEADHLAAIQFEFAKYGPFKANETGERLIRGWLKKYTLSEIFKAIETSFTQYIRTDDNDQVTGESWSKAFDMVPRIIEVNRRGGLSEDMRRIFYARGILRRRLSWLKEADVVNLMRDAVNAGLDCDDLVQIAKGVRSWREFEDIMYSWILGDGK